MEKKIGKCANCKYLGFDHKNGGPTYKCKKDHTPDFPEDGNIDDFEVECEDFKSRYIEYPLTITKIEQKENKIEPYFNPTGSLVKIRPCGEQYGGKTYLGILLGNAPVSTVILHNPETGVLSISPMTNPAIFVPDLKEIIYGMGSWWGVITSEEQLKEISDLDIDNVWYVQALKSLIQENAKAESDEGGE